MLLDSTHVSYNLHTYIKKVYIFSGIPDYGLIIICQTGMISMGGIKNKQHSNY